MNLRFNINYLKVMDAGGKKLLALFPAKFQRSMWIKRGLFFALFELTFLIVLCYCVNKLMYLYISLSHNWYLANSTSWNVFVHLLNFNKFYYNW